MHGEQHGPRRPSSFLLPLMDVAAAGPYTAQGRSKGPSVRLHPLSGFRYALTGA